MWGVMQNTKLNYIVIEIVFENLCLWKRQEGDKENVKSG